MRILAHQPNKGLVFLLSLTDKGNVAPTVKICYKSSKLTGALKHIRNRQIKGKIIITV
ncbi:hypothetical protein [Aquimarina sp. AU474]|uniref:hypothetical protein n=1 Tax=Aquimarina sp. AU474 TaxID=2108529 RepID=UPI001357A646|nr:hypothetical protein [Aquimarina sp. AU474]